MFLPTITFIFLMLEICSSLDTIPVYKTISDGETIVSRNGKFELGFFSPGFSKYRYLGIWFTATSPRTVTWVANRETPLIDTSGMVKLDSQGILSLVNDGGSIIWSSNSSSSSTKDNPVAQLLDTGNLVIKNENRDEKEYYVWRSFDYPGDTYLPGMKLGKNLITGRETYLTSWRNADDPFPGEYTLKVQMVHGQYQQVYIRKGSSIETRLGPYNGIGFSGQTTHENDFYMVVNLNEIYFAYTSSNSTAMLLRMILTHGGRLEVSPQNLPNSEWIQDLILPLDYCDNYGVCGPYGSCSTAISRKCGCLTGFQQVTPDDESNHDTNSTIVCGRSRALNCGPGEGFFKFPSMKLPDTQNAMFYGSMGLKECEVSCKNRCSCTAYSVPNITSGGVGCLLWFGDLIDVRVYPQNGQDLYVRLAESELLDIRSKPQRKKEALFVVVFTLLISASWTSMCLIFCCKRNKISDTEREDHKHSSHKGSIEVPLFSLSKVSRATHNFSVDNKLGEGGFGPVYKGVLEEGQEIAVKRLSKSSRQGFDEFENEVLCIAKLQHRNLVKLIGYCIQGDEIMLIYEFMPNKSLDRFIFDELSKSLLDWPHRFHIIHGIARGLLYLHQDSRLTVVHRDLKASNILLDHDMNPKISDFGLARMFTEHESEVKTKRVVGTLGYISPEYAGNGLFSVKSDIFSFGVLVLEIVSGKKNRGVFNQDHHDNLLGHAWRLHKKGKSLDLIDASLGESYSVSEVIRSIHIGLLCVQQLAEDRPTTPYVVSMLSGEGLMPSPKQPGFFIQGSEKDSTPVLSLPPSVNRVTLSQIEGR